MSPCVGLAPVTMPSPNFACLTLSPVPRCGLASGVPDAAVSSGSRPTPAAGAAAGRFRERPAAASRGRSSSGLSRDQPARYVGEEPRGQAGSRHPPEAPPEGPQQVQTLLGPRDAHVGQPALLLHLGLVLQRADVRQQALLHADYEHGPKLEPLGLV